MAERRRRRAERRELEREAEKLGRDLERLARAEQGGAPDRPIVIESPSEVEVRAREVACARCRGPVELLEHVAKTIAGSRLRIAELKCKACGSKRGLYFQLRSERVN